MTDGKHGYGALMAIIAALLMALVALAMAAKEAEAFTPVKGAGLGFGVRCDPSVKTAHEDPIVYPGQHHVGHLHDFFGAQNINPDSTPDSIREGTTSCAFSGDKAAYWVPAALNTSVHQMIAYYNPGPGRENSALNPYSRGLQIIAGSVPHDEDSTPSPDVQWGCQGRVADDPLPVDCGDRRAKVEVEFPNCQSRNASGELIDDSTNHRNHMAYSDRRGRCPSTHPYKVAKLNIHVIYEAHDGRRIQFAVDPHDFHADFMNGWDEATLKQAIAECITDARFGCQRISDEAPRRTVEPVIPGPNSECPGAEVVNTTTGTGNEQSSPFSIEGDRFRITISVAPTSRGPGVTAFIVNAENNQNVTSVDKEGPGTGSSVVNAGPGKFYLDLNTANADNAVVVEDCVDSDDIDGSGSGGGGSGGGDNDRNRNNDNRNTRNIRNNDNNRNNRIVVIDDGNRDGNRVVAVDGAARRQYGEDEVIVETIPDKGRLANTGGSAVILAAGALLLGAGLLLGRSVVRRAL